MAQKDSTARANSYNHNEKNLIAVSKLFKIHCIHRINPGGGGLECNLTGRCLHNPFRKKFAF